MPDLGQLKYLFNRSYTYTDPQYVGGLGIWRDTNVPAEPENVFGLFALEPIIDTYDKDTETSNLSFSINSLQPVEDVETLQLTRNTSYIKSLLGQLRRPAQSGSPMAGMPVVQTTLPMQSSSSARAVVIGFDIADLPYVEIKPAKKFSVRTNDYNGNNPVEINATVPIIEESTGNIVDLSFDITALDYV